MNECMQFWLGFQFILIQFVLFKRHCHNDGENKYSLFMRQTRESRTPKISFVFVLLYRTYIASYFFPNRRTWGREKFLIKKKTRSIRWTHSIGNDGRGIISEKRFYTYFTQFARENIKTTFSVHRKNQNLVSEWILNIHRRSTFGIDSSISN